MNYRYIGDFNTDSITTKLQDITQENWEEFNLRQVIYQAHRQTLTIPILFHHVFDPLSVTADPKWSSLFSDELSTLKELGKNTYGKGNVFRAMLVNLKAGGLIPQHIDTSIIKGETHRVHIPIITNDDVIFKVGDELKNMKQGECWEIYNLEQHHGVNNYSSTDRIHLIFDYLVE